jgi:hypothetical protein
MNALALLGGRSGIVGTGALGAGATILAVDGVDPDVRFVGIVIVVLAVLICQAFGRNGGGDGKAEQGNDGVGGGGAATERGNGRQ